MKVSLINMSHRARTVVSLILLVAAVATVPAQAQKIGYTNQQAILNSMPEMQDVRQEMQKEAKQQEREFQRKRQKLQKQLKQYQQQRSLLDSSARARRERKLSRRRQELQQSSQKRRQRLRQRRRKLMQPLLKDLQSAINLVADRENMDMVVRSQALLHVNKTSDQVVDVTSDVANELGISLDQASGRPSPNVNPTQTSPPPGGGGGQ